MQDEAMDAARSAPQGVHYHAYTNSVPDQQSLYFDGPDTFAFYIKNVPPVGQLLSSYLYLWAALGMATLRHMLGEADQNAHFDHNELLNT